MKIAGGYPAKYSYINEDFKTNHLDLYLFYFTNADDLHSIANSPNSTYDQLLSEYGIAGLFCFVVFYIGFFMRRLKKQSYGIPLLLLMAGIFFTDYWFEQLSVVVLFELLLFLNSKELALTTDHDKSNA
jgi:O-antigen ligase